MKKIFIITICIMVSTFAKSQTINYKPISDSIFIKKSNEKLDSIISGSKRLELKDSTTQSRKLITVSNPISDSNFVKLSNFKLDSIIKRNDSLLSYTKKILIANDSLYIITRDSLRAKLIKIDSSLTYLNTQVSNNVDNAGGLGFSIGGRDGVTGNYNGLSVYSPLFNGNYNSLYTSIGISGISQSLDDVQPFPVEKDKASEIRYIPIGGYNATGEAKAAIFSNTSALLVSPDNSSVTNTLDISTISGVGNAAQDSVAMVGVFNNTNGNAAYIQSDGTNILTTDANIKNAIRAQSTAGLGSNITVGGHDPQNNATKAIVISPNGGMLTSGRYNSSAPSTTSGNIQELQVDINGNLKTVGQTSTAIIGKVGIDQTTQGTTNFVTANQTQINGVAVATGNGVVSTGVQRVSIASDNSPISNNITQVAGVAIAQGNGTAATAIRVVLPTDGTGVVGLNAGTNTIGNTNITLATAQFNKITDGTNTVAVKAASTAAVATDPSAVIAISPNSNIVKLSEIQFTQSTGNSTIVQLAAAAIFTGTVQSVLTGNSIIVSYRADQPTILIVTQFQDAAGLVTVSTETFTRLANQPYNEAIKANGNYYRITLQNTGAATTTNLNCETWHGIMEPFPRALTNKGNFKVSLEETSNGTITQTNTTITTGGTAQTAIALNTLRSGFEIVNTSSAPLYINFSGTATITSLTIPVGASYSRYTGKIPTNAISIIGATTGQTFTILESN